MRSVRLRCTCWSDWSGFAPSNLPPPALTQYERYCDGIIVYARSEDQAQHVRAMIASRLADCGLSLNERKTRIVYCKGSW
ncbi:MAG: reverse transcriptase domain-containing protein [Actinomycetota bacterium]|nr:reverse transcriptase domain-containing protein [Actinomycetota bacterium]